MNFIPVILAGGSGTRLWPLSRKNFPKQFLKLHGEASLLQETVARVKTLNPLKIIIVSNEAHYFLCQEQLEQYGNNIEYILEPCARNTAPAIAAAAHYIESVIAKDSMMLVLPSDHWIGDNNIWQEAMFLGIQYAKINDYLITFGIKPRSPKTGYGYIEAGVKLEENIFNVNCFIEKPDSTTAQEFINKGNFYWNSGMFVFSATTYLSELKKYAPEIYSLTQLAYENGQKYHNYLRLNTEAFGQCLNESIDYTIMEKTQRAALIPVEIPWNDLGCWTAVAEANSNDDNGNVIQGKALVKDSQNCLISSEKTLVTTLGIKDQIIVVTEDAILVADKKYSQQVKDIVSNLGSEHQQLAQDHQKVVRPWGYYEILAEGPTFKVKGLMVKPKAKLSLQMHQHRAEHWVVVGGTAEVVNHDKVFLLNINESTYIPPKTRHRLSNPGSEPLFVIEVQSGSYLGEDDIRRFDDIYSRPTEEVI